MDFTTMAADASRTVHAELMALDAKAAPGFGRVDSLVRLAGMFERAARAVRRSIIVYHKLADVPRPATPATTHPTVARKRILREVEEVIRRNARLGWAKELQDRPDHTESDDGDWDDEDWEEADPDEMADDRPAAEIVADICRDLGLAAKAGPAPWTRRAPADLVALCTLAVRPVWPCAEGDGAGRGSGA